MTKPKEKPPEKKDMPEYAFLGGFESPNTMLMHMLMFYHPKANDQKPPSTDKAEKPKP